MRGIKFWLKIIKIKSATFGSDDTSLALDDLLFEVLIIFAIADIVTRNIPDKV